MTGHATHSTSHLAAKHAATVNAATRRFLQRVGLAFVISFGGIFFAQGDSHPTRALAWAAVAAGVRAIIGVLTPVDPAVGVKFGEFKPKG